MAEWKKVIVSGSNAELNQVTASAFSGDGSGLTNVPAGSVNIESFTDGTGITVANTDKLLLSDGGTEKYINVSQLPFTTDTNTFRTIEVNDTETTTTLEGTETLQLRQGSNISLSESGGVVTIASTDTNTQLSGAQVKDFAGAMFTGNTETGITATYQTADDTVDLVVADSDFALTGDVTATATQTAKGNVSLATTIASAAVHHGMLNDDIISGQGALTSGLASTDEFMISDAGTVKKMDVSVLQSYMQSNLTFTTNTDTVRSVTVTNGEDTNTLTSEETLALTAGSNITLSESEGVVTIAGTANTQLSNEQVQDIAGPLVATGGTKTRISVTYDDANNNMDFVVDDMNFSVSDITGATALTSGLASTDELVLSDAGTLKRMDVSVLESYMQDNLTFTSNTDVDVSVANLKTRLGQGFGSNAVSIGDSSDTVTIPGNLTVSGTTTTVNTDNLAVKDVIISLNEGAESSADVAIVEKVDGAAIGYDTSDNRWKFDFAGASAGENSVSFDASIAAVVTSDDSNYRKTGNIRVQSDEIYIYV